LNEYRGTNPKALIRVSIVHVLNIPVPSLVLLKEARKDFTPRFAERGKGSEKMRKTLLVFLTILSVAPMLSGCFYPYRDDWYGRGYQHDRGYHEDRGYDGQRDGYRDTREHR
jgi:hypothetical protein